MFAVIRDGSLQLKVAEGDVIEVERVDLEKGASYQFDVLAINRDGKTTFGTPLVKGASVTGEVLAEVKGKKIEVQTFKRRKHEQSRSGHRQRRTKIRIKSITG